MLTRADEVIEITTPFAAVRIVANGTNQTNNDVRYSVANGDKADVTRTSSKST